MNSEVSLKMAEIKLIYQIDLFCGQKILYLTRLNYKELKLIIKINDEKKEYTLYNQCKIVASLQFAKMGFFSLKVV